MTGLKEPTSRSQTGSWTVGLGKAEMPVEIKVAMVQAMD